MTKFLSALILSFTLLGCATFNQHQGTAKLVTQYAVMKFAEQSSAERRDERIANVRKVAEGVKAVVGNEAVSIEGLQSLVGDQIAKLNLSPADTFLALALVQAISDELKVKVGEGVLTAEQKVQVSEVMDWVIQAAAFVPKVNP